jgi:predicted transcriptional regulator of viral defense system
MSQTKTEQLREEIGSSGSIRAKDLRKRGIHREYLRRLEKQGEIVRVGRGLYTLSNLDLTEHQTLVEACARVPHAVVCLFSALRFHNLTTQNPEALRESWQHRCCTMDELWHYAKICRVANVMRPYLESLT